MLVEQRCSASEPECLCSVPLDTSFTEKILSTAEMMVSGDNISTHCHDTDAGSWSDDISPSCVPIQCPPLEISSPHLRLVSLNNSFR